MMSLSMSYTLELRRNTKEADHPRDRIILESGYLTYFSVLAVQNFTTVFPLMFLIYWFQIEPLLCHLAKDRSA
jgi:hypothetical protein